MKESKVQAEKKKHTHTHKRPTVETNNKIKLSAPLSTNWNKKFKKKKNIFFPIL